MLDVGLNHLYWREELLRYLSKKEERPTSLCQAYIYMGRTWIYVAVTYIGQGLQQLDCSLLYLSLFLLLHLHKHMHLF